MSDFDWNGCPVLLVGTGPAAPLEVARLIRAGARVSVAGTAEQLCARGDALARVARRLGVKADPARESVRTALEACTFVGAEAADFDADAAASGAAAVVCAADDAAETKRWRALSRRHGKPFSTLRSGRPGVALVGGGPGDPQLMTEAARQHLMRADVVLYDKLAPTAVLEQLCPGALLVNVGKDPGHHKMPQYLIERALVEFARAGACVVRFKGGDPFVFGRGAEERRTLQGEGIEVTVVSGISSSIAVPAAAGIPVTCRGINRSFTVISGHEVPAPDELEGLVKVGGTLVVLMGLAHLPELMAGLVKHGLDPELPAAVVEKGSTQRQRVFASAARSIARVVSDEGVSSPAIVVLGHVVELGDDLARLIERVSNERSEESEPLKSPLTRGPTAEPAAEIRDGGIPGRGIRDGRIQEEPGTASSTVKASEKVLVAPSDSLTGFVIAVTASRRAEDQAEAFERRGATVLKAPTMRIVPTENDETLHRASAQVIEDKPGVLLVTTGHGVRGWFEAAEAGGTRSQLCAALEGADILVRGAKARGAIKSLGLVEQGVASQDSTSSLVDLALSRGVADKHVVFQQHGAVDHAHVERLERAGARLTVVQPYRWEQPRDVAAVSQLMLAIIKEHVNAVTFTSAPAVEALFERAQKEGTMEPLLEALRHRVLSVAVGHVTAEPLQRAGITPLIPDRPRMGSLVRALTTHLERQTVDLPHTPFGQVTLRGAHLLCGERRVELPSHLANITRVVMQAAGDLVTRQSIRREVPAAPSDHAIDMAISRIRKLTGEPKLILTVPKMGFRANVSL
ncbi:MULTISPECIES: uroporphyrinogen-III synthase [Kocuria]|uniref:uroporphyrinogen-III synthase n=1 Tax=Kocuria TaxID=57493 RepID=UPI0026550FE7|nr:MULTISPECIES: uroporphyrinogen-III synthase [Kocuria]MCT1723888.1 uroporphyrinogen-III synthase [Kocuria marina]MDN5699106.1 uroporphyrinogen-III synthase [Kocuria sp.]